MGNLRYDNLKKKKGMKRVGSLPEICIQFIVGCHDPFESMSKKMIKASDIVAKKKRISKLKDSSGAAIK